MRQPICPARDFGDCVFTNSTGPYLCVFCGTAKTLTRETPMPDELQFPNINLNGANGMDLALQYNEAANAVEKAANLMGQLVHGRDYQGADNFAFAIATEQMVKRIAPLIQAYNDLMRIAHHCADNAR